MTDLLLKQREIMHLKWLQLSLLNGATVGAVANRTKVYDDDMNVAAEFDAKLTAKGCNKAAEFVNFCDAFNIPVLTLTNVNGFAATMCQEKWR